MKALPFIALLRIHRVVALLMLIAFFCSISRGSTNDVGLEYRIKAAYLYNFTKFIEWPPPPPATAEKPFVLGVLDPEGTAYTVISESLRGKTGVNGRAIAVRRLAALDETATSCNQIFITRASGMDVAQVRKVLDGLPIVVVGETVGFAEQGGVIGFVLTGDAVHCEINLAGAQRAGVKLSGRLASVARLVHETR
ncbi:MAG TPA: YfiR family protein [Opitutaceae bacterium]